VSGGLVPQAQRGTKNENKCHVADWYATFCGLAGVDPIDHSAAAVGLPAVDSIDLWPSLTGANATAPRDVIPLAIDVGVGKKDVYSAVIMGDWKWVVGLAILQSFHQGPQYPNASIIPYGEFNNKSYIQECIDLGPLGGGCLYNLASDPNELENVAGQNIKIVKQMRDVLNALRSTKYQEASDLSQEPACLAAKDAYGNFFGPWLK
jgi:arylsulfatase I/J